MGESRTYRAIARDRSRIVVEHDLTFEWHIAEGEGRLENERSEIVTFTAPYSPDELLERMIELSLYTEENLR